MGPIEESIFDDEENGLQISFESGKSSGHQKGQKRRKPKNIDRFILADVTANCTLPSPCSRLKGKGKRRQHRMENVKYLLNLWSKDDEELDMVNQSEVMETPFTQIVTDDNLRKIWDNFSELSGEKQDEYLAFIKHGVLTSSKCANTSDKIPSHMDDELRNSSNTYADLCYHRMEKRLRNALNKKHVPLGLLEKLETELIDFFKLWPKSKYTSVLSSSYERLLMHALCQYLGLSSQSITHGGSRCTQVQTKRDGSFHPPQITLSQYIKDRLSPAI